MEGGRKGETKEDIRGRGERGGRSEGEGRGKEREEGGREGMRKKERGREVVIQVTEEHTTSCKVSIKGKLPQTLPRTTDLYY